MSVVCGECGAEMVLRESAKLNRKFWGCSRFPECRGTHGAHQSDGRPLGIPANAETKKARIAAHAAFDLLWKGGRMPRKHAYKKLAERLNVPEVHIGESGIEMCMKIVDVSKALANENTQTGEVK